LGEESASEVLEGGEGVDMLRTQKAGLGFEGALIGGPCCGEVALGVEGAGEVLEGGEGVWVLGSEASGHDFEGSLEVGPRAAEVALSVEGAGEVLERVERVGMLRSEESGLGVEGALVHRAGLGEVALGVEGAGEVLEGAQGVWVLVAKDRDEDGERSLCERARRAAVASGSVVGGEGDGQARPRDVQFPGRLVPRVLDDGGQPWVGADVFDLLQQPQQRPRHNLPQLRRAFRLSVHGSHDARHQRVHDDVVAVTAGEGAGDGGVDAGGAAVSEVVVRGGVVDEGEHRVEQVDWDGELGKLAGGAEDVPAGGGEVGEAGLEDGGDVFRVGVWKPGVGEDVVREGVSCGVRQAKAPRGERVRAGLLGYEAAQDVDGEGVMADGLAQGDGVGAVGVRGGAVFGEEGEGVGG
jgi:hypothetical protein